MQLSIRKVSLLVGLPLAAIALALFAMSLGNGVTKVHAAVDSNVNFSITANGGACDSDGATTTPPITTKCTEGLSSVFTVAFNLKSLPSNGTYDGYDAQINYTSGLTTVPTSGKSLCQTNPTVTTNPCSSPPRSGNWPDCSTNFSDFTVAGTASFGCTIGIGAPSSTYVGALAHLDFTCGSTPSTQTLSLMHGDNKTDLIDSSLAAHSEAAAPASETLTINCAAAPNTPTPLPTATPPPQPRVAKTCKQTVKPTPPGAGTPTPPQHPTGETTGGAICNHFLVREGAKRDTARCQDSINVVNLNEGINIPITSANPKAGQPFEPAFQQLGAFEFEVRFDAKLVCVSIVGAGPFSPAPNIICTTLDDGNKGLVRFGCVSLKKNQNLNAQCTTGCTLAVISVRPTSETENQLRPNQDNGIPVQLMNQGCQLSDDQGHEIPIFSCEDADVTFRFLEGDVSGPDCVVNVMDAQQEAFRWGARTGSLLFNSFNDLSPSGQIKGDGRIDIQDLQFVFGRLNSTCNAPYPPQLPVNPKA